jgi:hypothetical protein
MMRNNVQRLGEHRHRRAAGSAQAMSAEVAIVAGTGVRLVTRRRRPSPSAPAPCWRSAGVAADCGVRPGFAPSRRSSLSPIPPGAGESRESGGHL